MITLPTPENCDEIAAIEQAFRRPMISFRIEAQVATGEIAVIVNPCTPDEASFGTQTRRKTIVLCALIEATRDALQERLAQIRVGGDHPPSTTEQRSGGLKLPRTAAQVRRFVGKVVSSEPRIDANHFPTKCAVPLTRSRMKRKRK